LCQNLGKETKGSELVGLVPLKAMLDAGLWYAGEGLSDEEYIFTAIECLGLNSIGEFNPKERIIELALKEE
jgi:glutamate formiminotransferase/formiminotetrahydrofolate cyclodeaminase